MKHLKGFCLILVAWLWVSSCTDQIVYHSYRHFNKEGWSKGDTVTLDLHITDSIAANTEITFLLRNRAAYPYHNFAAIVLHNLPDTTSWKGYKVNFTLADRNGRWNGSGWGGLYQSSVSLGNVYISHPGVYTFKVVHQMNSEQLCGLSDIGVLIQKEVVTEQ